MKILVLFAIGFAVGQYASLVGNWLYIKTRTFKSYK